MRVAMLSSFGTERCGIRLYSETLCHYFERAGVDIVRIPVEQKNTRFAVYITRLRDGLLSARPDLIHIQHEFSFFGGLMGANFILVLLALRRLDVPIVVTMHTVLRFPRPIGGARSLSELIYNLLRWLHRLLAWISIPVSVSLIADTVIVHTNACRRLMPIRQRVIVVPLGTEVLDDHSPPRLEAEQRLKVITFGFFDWEKGIDLAYRAVRLMPDIDYVVAGNIRIDARDQTSYLMRLSSEKTDNTSIVICFPVPSRLISCSDVVLLPYRTGWMEHASAVFHRALALGKPVVASRVGEMAEYERYCLTFEPESASAILDGLRKMRLNELRNYYAQKAKELSRRTAFPLVASAHMKLYEGLISRRLE
jgi:glycosyltransferase involved in cell wall biosynthesis